MTAAGLFPFVSGVSAAAAELWLAACWQGLVVVGVVALCLRVLPGWSATHRSLVWVGVLGLLVGLHFLPLFYGVHHAILSPKAGQQTAWLLSPRWALALAGAWLLLLAMRGFGLVRDLVRVRGIVRRATPQPHLGGAVPVCSSPEVTRPCAAGYRHPRILLPEGLAGELSTAELEQVLLHEAAHLRRNDHWINLLQKLLLVLFPLNPAMLIVEHRLCLERELACDDQVMRLTGARKSYAACLARIAEHRLLGRSVVLALGAWDRRPALVRRVERILRSSPAELSGWRARVYASAVLALAAAITAGLVETPALVRFGNAPPAVASTLAAPVTETYGQVRFVKAVLPTLPKPSTPERVKVRRTHMVHTLRANPPSMVPSHDAARTRRVEVRWPVSRQQAGAAAEPFYLPAMLYLVPTPQGWVVIQL